MANYSKDGEFGDPIVRCTECSKIVFRERIQEEGMCPHCGNRRVRNVLAVNEDEMQMLKDKKVDPEFLKLWEGVDDA